MTQIFRRKIYSKLLEWKNKSNGQTALLIEGARRVGKSTVVYEFVKKEYKSHLIIDFANVSNRTMELFKNGLGEGIDDFLMKLQVSEGVSLVPRDGAIVFDEVQKCTKAREMIKYLVADGRFDYIETGSLISVITKQKDAMIPSEERHICMYPMDFEEFLWAQGDETSIPYLRSMFEKREPMGESFHSKFLQKFREYMVIGGMPKVVSVYGKSTDIDSAEDAKKDIITLYYNDIVKLENIAGTKIQRVFENIPSMLSMNNKIFSPGKVKKGSRTRDYISAISGLKDAMLINECIDCTDPTPALRMSMDDDIVKCYLLDTGLLVTMALGSEEAVSSSIYKNLILGRLSINNGMFFENVVAQQLVASGHRLVFSKFRYKDPDTGEEKPYEADFLLSRANKLVPIEVKSSSYRECRSLDAFMKKYQGITGEGYVIHAKDLSVDGDKTCIPVYMASFL